MVREARLAPDNMEMTMTLSRTFALAVLLAVPVAVNAQQVWVPGPPGQSMQTWMEMNTGQTKTFVYPQHGYGSYPYANPVDGFVQSYIRGYQAGQWIRQQNDTPRSATADWGYDGGWEEE